MARNADLAKILAALGNDTRLALVKRLAVAETFGGQSITELAEGTGQTRQAVTKHLEALAAAGLASRLKLGKATWYEFNAEPLNTAIEALAAIVKQRVRSQMRLKAAKEKLMP